MDNWDIVFISAQCLKTIPLFQITCASANFYCAPLLVDTAAAGSFLCCG